MLDLVPLAGARRIMTDRDVQPRLVRPTLQLHLPEPQTIAIAAPAISTDQDPSRLSIEGVAHLAPPTANTLHGETRRVVGTAHGHPPLIAPLIVDPTRHRLGDVRVGEIVPVHLDGLPFRLPFLPGIPVVPDQFLLLGVDRDDGPASAQERLALASDVAKLSIPIGMLLPLFGLGITLQAVA